jgi:hypothetical protein
MPAGNAIRIFNNELLVVRLSGDFNFATLCGLAAELKSAEAGALFVKQLVYVEDITSVQLSSEDALFYRAQRPERRQRTKTAFCAFSDMQYGYARMFQSYLETEVHTIEIFRDLADAVRWLGVDEKAFMAWHAGSGA